MERNEIIDISFPFIATIDSRVALSVGDVGERDGRGMMGNRPWYVVIVTAVVVGRHGRRGLCDCCGPCQHVVRIVSYFVVLKENVTPLLKNSHQDISRDGGQCIKYRLLNSGCLEKQGL